MATRSMTVKEKLRSGVNGVASLLGVLLVACQGSRVTPPQREALPSARVDGTAPGAVASSVVFPAFHPLLKDPRLSKAYALARDHEWASAAAALSDVETSLAPDPRPDDEKCAWKYVSGRLLLAAGQAKEAAAAFDAARGGFADAGVRCPLGNDATFRAADAHLKAGDFAAAADLAGRVELKSIVHDDAELVLASALVGLGRALEAVPIWRAALAKSSKVWVDVALPLASALLDGAEGNSDEPAEEALRLATRIIVEAPRIAESSGAARVRERALQRLAVHDPKRPRDLSLTLRVQQARAWLDAGEASKATVLTATILKEPAVAKNAVVYCAASIVRAQSLAKTKAGAGTAWDEAIAHCEHDGALVTALFSGAKSAAGKHPDVARARYARVEELFHDHRLADDARFQGALLALGQGDEASFTQMMLTLPDDFPQGDQRTEALFRVALLRMTKGDWQGAVPMLDRIDNLTPEDQHWATAGRAQYFRARVDQAEGRSDDARARYARVLKLHPFAYYMAQAYARLAEGDPTLATRTLAAAFAREDNAPFLMKPHAELATPAFAHAVMLLEAFDVELGRREIAAAGASREDVDPEVAWTVARLYDEALAPELGHALARQKLRDYLSHYPVGAWRTKWQIAYPPAFDDLVVRESTTSGVPPSLTWAIMREESDFIADAKSASNAFGLMQLIVPTARGVARGTGLPFDEASLKDPTVSVALGARLLGQLRSSFASNKTLAIAAYNGGGGAVGRWIAARGDDAFDLWVEEIPWDETRGYEKRVLSSEATYAYLYDPAALDEVLRLPRRARGAVSTDAGGIRTGDSRVPEAAP